MSELLTVEKINERLTELVDVLQQVNQKIAAMNDEYLQLDKLYRSAMEEKQLLEQHLAIKKAVDEQFSTLQNKQ